MIVEENGKCPTSANEAVNENGQVKVCQKWTLATIQIGRASEQATINIARVSRRSSACHVPVHVEKVAKDALGVCHRPQSPDAIY